MNSRVSAALKRAHPFSRWRPTVFAASHAGQIRKPNVPNLARFHEAVEGFRGLFNRRVRIHLVSEINVDVVGSQSPQTSFGSREDVMPRESMMDQSLSASECGFCRNHDVFPAISQRLS